MLVPPCPSQADMLRPDGLALMRTIETELAATARVGLTLRVHSERTQEPDSWQSVWALLIVTLSSCSVDQFLGRSATCALGQKG